SEILNRIRPLTLEMIRTICKERNIPIGVLTAQHKLGPCPRPDNYKLPFGIKNDPCSELLTSPIQCLLDPFDVPPRWNGEAKVLDLQGNQFERMEASAGRIQVREIHQGKIVTVALVTTDAFIVVQEITAAIENEAVSIDFDRSRMM